MNLDEIPNHGRELNRLARKEPACFGTRNEGIMNFSGEADGVEGKRETRGLNNTEEYQGGEIEKTYIDGEGWTDEWNTPEKSDEDSGDFIKISTSSTTEVREDDAEEEEMGRMYGNE